MEVASYTIYIKLKLENYNLYKKKALGRALTQEEALIELRQLKISICILLKKVHP